jgi:formate hydrogenlyase transcriptional activator
MTSAEDRYRALLGASNALADQPTVRAILHSLRGVLSSSCRLHGAFLYVLGSDGESLHVLEFDREPDAPPIKIGTEISRVGAVAQVLEEQKPVFLPDVSKEMLIHPELAPFAPESIGRSTYMFPVSTSQQRYGILVVTKDSGQKFLPEDVDMLRAMAGHVAVALESALVRDSAELYEREAEKERDRLKLLLEINNHIVSKLEVNELFHAVAQSLRKYLGNDLSSFWLFNKQSSCLERKFLDFPTGRGILEKVTVAVPTQRETEWWRLSKPMFYSPEGSDTPPALREAARAESLLSAVAVPLVGADGPLGLFNVASHKADAFCQEDLDLLSQIGTQLSLALDNALAYEALRASHHDLQRSEAYLAEGQRLAHTGSWALDVASEKYVYVSEECLRIYGFDPQDGLPTREAVFRRIHPEDRDRVERSFAKSLSEKSDVSDELRIILPDGTVKHIQVIRHPVLNSAGDVVQLVGTSIDITEHKRAQEALRESEMRFRSFWDHAADAFCVFDEQHKIIDANREACESGGYTREELIGMVPQDFDPDVDAAMLQRMDDQIAAGEVCTFETRNRRKDGTVFPVEVRVRPYQSGGRRFHLASARNISERKRAEEERRQASERFRAIADYTYDWENWIGVDGKLLWVNPAVERITGYSVDECMAMPDFPMPIIAEADRQAVMSQMGKAIEGSSKNDFEFRVLRKDGLLAWVAAAWQPIYDSRGARLGHRSSIRDITERKRAEEALRRSEAYLAEAQRLTKTGSWTLDVATGEYSYWSQEMFTIFAIDPQSGLPKVEQVLKQMPSGDGDRIRQAIRTSFLERDTDFDFELALPDGITKRIHCLTHPLFRCTGEVVEVFGTVFDITERKRAEEALRESKAQLAQERDHLSLLLEITNYIANKLEVDELFEAVSASMRKHLGSDATTFWIINKDSGCLERKYIDFPTGAGFLKKVDVVVPGKLESEFWRMRDPQFYSPQDLPELPQALRDAIKAEALVSRVSVPLVGGNGPLGFINISSRKADAFKEADRDLLFQIASQISLALDNALAYGRLRASRDHLDDQRVYLESEISSEYNFEDVVGKSSAIKGVLQQVSVVAPTDSIVLLHGETGTGKELIARAIHNLSSRRDRSFVRMNCAAIPSGLLESELFGHERGAFTGALMQRRGRFELADHGTLFLDEIGDISLELQPKLLRAVQEQEFERLGSAKTIHVDVRIIAATHRDLRAMIREGKFREDLFYRLNVFPIEIPPLRERRQDIPLLVNHFVSKLSRRMGKKITSLPTKIMDALSNSPWRGNVRELANFIERAVIVTRGEELELPLAELGTSSGGGGASAMTAAVQEAERAMIIDALRAASGRISGKGGAAERLGIKRTTLQHKMQRLGISPNPVGRVPSNLGFRAKQ